jgi:hypothetical protein
MNINIPPEGYKIVCITGMFEGKPIWRQVGKLSVSKKSGMPVIMLDTIFSAAGVHKSEQQSGSVLLSCVEFSEEELEKKASYKKKDEVPKSTGFFGKDFDDDIPF